MKALTIWQPWASLIMAGAKPYEFRGWAAWPSAIGQRIVIHAGAPMIEADEIRELLRRLADPSVARFTGLLPDKAIPILERAMKEPAIFPRKHALGTALLGKPVLASDLWPEAFTSDSSRIEQSNWAWPLTDLEHFTPPIPSRGAQGFWQWGGKSPNTRSEAA